MSDILIPECPVIALVRATVRARCEAAGVEYADLDREANALADEAWPREWFDGVKQFEASEAENQANQHAYCRALLSLAPQPVTSASRPDRWLPEVKTVADAKAFLRAARDLAGRARTEAKTAAEVVDRLKEFDATLLAAAELARPPSGHYALDGGNWGRACREPGGAIFWQFASGKAVYEACDPLDGMARPWPDEARKVAENVARWIGRDAERKAAHGYALSGLEVRCARAFGFPIGSLLDAVAPRSLSA